MHLKVKKLIKYPKDYLLWANSSMKMYIERKENNLKLCSNQDLFIAFAVERKKKQEQTTK